MTHRWERMEGQVADGWQQWSCWACGARGTSAADGSEGDVRVGAWRVTPAGKVEPAGDCDETVAAEVMGS